MPRDIRRGKSYVARRVAWLNGICPYCERKTEIETEEMENGGTRYRCLVCKAENPFSRGSKKPTKKERKA